jgi:hypothetical protein
MAKAGMVTESKVVVSIQLNKSKYFPKKDDFLLFVTGRRDV